MALSFGGSALPAKCPGCRFARPGDPQPGRGRPRRCNFEYQHTFTVVATRDRLDPFRGLERAPIAGRQRRASTQVVADVRAVRVEHNAEGSGELQLDANQVGGQAFSHTARMQTPPAELMIRAEHAALIRVLTAMKSILDEAKWHMRLPDFDALRAMLFYIDEFPERLHHVKETAMLFARLREVAPESITLLDQLDRDHARGEMRVRELEHRLTGWQLIGESRRASFELGLQAYTAFYVEHIRVEETELLPLAQRVLCDEDWRMLERAFGLHGDALTQAHPQRHYEALFQTILAAMPAGAALQPSKA